MYAEEWQKSLGRRSGLHAEFGAKRCTTPALRGWRPSAIRLQEVKTKQQLMTNCWHAHVAL
jgi:hypothetical protein